MRARPRRTISARLQRYKEAAFTMKISTDLCIVGAAGSGLTAAVRARQMGVGSVVVLEKTSKPGGCTQLAGGIFGIDSPVQKRKGKYYSADQAFKDVIHVLNWNVDAKLVRKWICGSGENIRWLEELGMIWGDVVPFSGSKDKFRHTYHMSPAGNDVGGEMNAIPHTGLNIVKTLLKACEKLGGIEIRCKTRAEHLIRDENGAVSGVIASTADGEELEVRSKKVILCTGSISSNKDLIKRFYQSSEYNDIRIMAEVPHNTGDGLIMAEEVGAMAGRVSTLFIGPHNHFPGASEITGAVIRRPHIMCVNRTGERFVDESLVTDDEFGWMKSVNIDRQPGKVIYGIFDQALMDDMMENREVMNCVDGPSAADGIRFKNRTQWLDLLPAHCRKEEAAGRAKICSSIAEMAQYIGCGEKTLQKTIDDYNDACSMGYDAEFMKEPKYLNPVSTPPFYVLRGPSGIDTCIGGLSIDNHQRVIDNSSSPIPNLYAAGVLTSGWLAGVYAFFGSEMSYTIFSGRNAAFEASSEILSCSQ